MAEPKEFISKGRLDALTDGVFAFAMTLLVVKFDLPEDFHPKSAAELISGLLGLGGAFIAYVVTFLVLATFWLGRARTKDEPEEASSAYAWSVLLHLFFVTILPFSMIVVGRYDLWPAIGSCIRLRPEHRNHVCPTTLSRTAPTMAGNIECSTSSTSSPMNAWQSGWPASSRPSM
jgi:uncharacterized membrane protein